MVDIMRVDQMQIRLLEEVANLYEVPAGAYNIRANGQLMGRADSTNIEVVSKEDETGIDIHVKPGTKRENVHIPVMLSRGGLTEMVYNDFYIRDDTSMVIVAGCDTHNGGDKDLEHDGIHRFFLRKNAKVEYVERHYGEGGGQGKRILDPGIEVIMEKNSYMKMGIMQIKGVDSTKRSATANLATNAKLIIRERLLTYGNQDAVSGFIVNLNGDGSSANVISRSVAKDDSSQTFLAEINGNAKCVGHSEYDTIIMGNARINTILRITANNIDAVLIHEVATREIAGEQLIKLMTLGLTEAEVEAQIVNRFLK